MLISLIALMKPGVRICGPTAKVGKVTLLVKSDVPSIRQIIQLDSSLYWSPLSVKYFMALALRNVFPYIFISLSSKLKHFIFNLLRKSIR